MHSRYATINSNSIKKSHLQKRYFPAKINPYIFNFKNVYLPDSQRAPPRPTGHKHKNPGPVLLPKQVPPYLQGFVAQTGRSHKDPVNPGGQLQNQEPAN